MSALGKNLAPRQLAERRQKIDLILGGTNIASTAERLAGYPPSTGDEAADRRRFLEDFLVRGVRPEIVDCLQAAMQVRAGSDRIWHALNLLDRPSEIEVRDRLTLYLALEYADRVAQEILAAMIRSELARTRSMFIVDVVYAIALAAWLDTKPGVVGGKKLTERLDAMVQRLASDAIDIIAVKAALDDKPLVLEPAETLSPLNALSRLAHKLDESERSRAAVPEETTASPAGRSLVVVPILGDPTGSSARKDVYTQFKPISGLPLPIAGEVDLPAVRSCLLARYPHFAGEVDLILRQQRPYRLLLVGSPGCGKTSLARDLAAAIGLRSIVYPAGGASDASFGGTSAQWSTARASTPLQTVLRTRQADPLVVLDELEKSGTGSHNGSLVDALLSFLEPASARRILDPALEIEVDLSAVSYIATANSLDGVPAPLRDRFRVIRMPDPRPEHLEALMPTMLDDISADRGIDRRWLTPLAADELEIVHQAWLGGSLRRLRRVLELLLDGREQTMGRA